MDVVQTSSLRLADRTASDVLALWGRVEAGDLTVEQFRGLAAALIARANAQGVSLGDLGLSAEIARRLGEASAPLGLSDPVALDQERIAGVLDAAVAEVDDDTPDGVRSRIERVARSEPLISTANAVQAAMVRRGVRGWVRQLDADPCAVCRRWADGVVRSPETRMARHPGCGCIQAPVFT